MNPEAKEIIDMYFPVLDKGFVALKDVMGDDAAVEQAARVSYGAGTRKVSETRGLVRYLMRHKHCYHPEMEVLTAEGWKKWYNCNYEETFVIPNPDTKKLTFETLPVKSFDCDENIYTYENCRMSYAVTPEHKMWFKNKYKNYYEKVKVKDMLKWGHFENIHGYKYLQSNNSEYDIKEYCTACLVGFFLGDGHWESKSSIGFRLRKKRKIIFLLHLLQELNIDYKQKETNEEGKITQNFRFKFDKLKDFTHVGQKNKNKTLNINVNDLSNETIDGLFDGLVYSDGSFKKDRPQIEFSSTSMDLVNKLQLLSALKGYDSHRCKDFGTAHRINIYINNSATLESRKQYHNKQYYKGKVYCATSSTGWLLVRGKDSDFCFVSGNTTPTEMVEFKFHVRIPMDLHRQHIRTRNSSTNEYSTRYSVAINACQQTEPDRWRLQAKNNKQGSSGFINTNVGEVLSEKEEELQVFARDIYMERLNYGIAREQARKDLSLSTYTEFYWKIDLHNLFHYLKLRCDSHAQWEIRQLANTMAGMVKRAVPLSFEAWLDYSHHASNLTRLDKTLLNWQQKKISVTEEELQAKLKEIGMSKREYEEYLQKLEVPEVQNFDLDLSQAKDYSYFEELVR